MTDPWRFRCPHCGSCGYGIRSPRGRKPEKNPGDRYRCNNCRETFDKRLDMKSSAKPEVPADD